MNRCRVIAILSNLNINEYLNPPADGNDYDENRGKTGGDYNEIV